MRQSNRNSEKQKKVARLKYKERQIEIKKKTYRDNNGYQDRYLYTEVQSRIHH